ncbi:hypothetical protein A2738_00775 [Candidatus Nomurabacteria bacterium RIFCSPHIGHO2_01_FULL_42_15]|uniref:Uncharacterized protein n=1 Tax=Candidatus Nomurabacteria bacterium RIFCSPHIGHO2_01_FULL_42_15 TaxID=1801742 RepID=A0A1F6VFP0_9BACT|nr:MAG: hypothetical protein A2738_00775 [Candidatus Nomurabacteria bacterium RIFCSPHIGHO2_01_FULL_42_15]OGI93168.1 MAG: hypothetical protein A3A99_01395 [Candidatus Nomurabacteria bacterium RIFCSPLOWO2_01_FULL_41_18]
MIEPKMERIAIIIIIGSLVIGNVFFGFNYFTLSREIGGVKSGQSKVETNEKIINFTSMFIEKVLQADTEVDFETRLTLENAVRDLKDAEVMAEWQNFTGSGAEADAQNSVKKLLGILIGKIQK